MSHTAILARSLGIPAVVGVRHATHCLRHGESLIVDGKQGIVLANADATTISHYQERIDNTEAEAVLLRKLIGQPAVTQDGQTILAVLVVPSELQD